MLNAMDLQCQSDTFNFANSQGLPDAKFNDSILGYKSVKTTVLAPVIKIITCTPTFIIVSTPHRGGKRI